MAPQLPPPEWYLFDARELKLMAHGTRSFSGVSARKNLASRAERVHMLALVDDLRHHKSIDETTTQVEENGLHWTLIARRIRGPFSHEPVAIQSICHLASDPPPPPPVVGAWEWEISPDGTIRNSFWDQGMFDLYGYEESSNHSPHGPMSPSRWFTEVIDPRDRHAMKLSITKGIADAASQLQTLSYRVRPRIHRGDESTIPLQLAGRAFKTVAVTWLRGVSFLREGGSVRKTTWEGDLPLEELSHLYMSLIPDCVLAGISIRDWTLFDVSAGWERSGLALGRGDIRDFTHPDDHGHLLDFLTEASHDSHPRPYTAPVRFLLDTKEWHPCKIAAGGIQLDDGFGTYVGLRITL